MFKTNSYIASPPSQDFSFDQCGFAVAVLWVVCCLLSPATVSAHVTRRGCKVGACSRWLVYPLECSLWEGRGKMDQERQWQLPLSVFHSSAFVRCPGAFELGGHDLMEPGLG